MIPRFDFNYSLKDFIAEWRFDAKNSIPDTAQLQDYFEGYSLTFIEKARVGISLALAAAGLKPGSGVGVQPFTCSSVLLAIKNAGYQVVFIDIDANFRLSKEDLKFKNHLIDALVVTHTFGYPENIESLKPIIGNKAIIEDCAQAYLSEIDGKPVGLKGMTGIFSMGYGKLFGIGSGGFSVSKNSSVLSKLHILGDGQHFQSALKIKEAEIKSLITGALYNPFIYNAFTYTLKKLLRKDVAGMQLYPDKEYLLSASRVNLFAKRFEADRLKLQHQQRNGRLLTQMIENRFRVVTPLAGSSPNFFLVPVQCPDRDKIVVHLAGKGIEAGKHFSNSIHWVRHFGYQEGLCPEFERIAREILTLPCHYYLSEERIKHIAASLNSYHERH